MPLRLLMVWNTHTFQERFVLSQGYWKHHFLPVLYKATVANILWHFIRVEIRYKLCSRWHRNWSRHFSSIDATNGWGPRDCLMRNLTSFCFENLFPKLFKKIHYYCSLCFVMSILFCWMRQVVVLLPLP
jgi:hypothetical protein